MLKEQPVEVAVETVVDQGGHRLRPREEAQSPGGSPIMQAKLDKATVGQGQG